MRKLTATLCLTLAVLLGSVGVSVSADLQKGITAAQRGDYATAIQEWEPLAKQGDAGAREIFTYGLESVSQKHRRHDG